LLFFATGLDRQILLIFGHSLTTHPPGQLAMTPALVDALVKTGSTIFTTGIRLMLPLSGLLIMVEISLALLSRLNMQLHLMMLAFPIKMMLSLTLLAWLVMVFPKVFAQQAGRILQLIHAILS